MPALRGRPPWGSGTRAANAYIAPARGPRAMGTLLGALARYLLVAIVAYTAFRAADLAAPADVPRGILLAAMGPGLPADPGAHAPLVALDMPAFLAMAAAPFLLYAAASRAVAPRAAFPPRALARALCAATAPILAWLGACDGAVGRALRARTAREAPLAAAVGACTMYPAAFLADLLALSVGHPAPPLDPLYGALYGALSHVPGAGQATFRAADALAHAAALATMPFLASAAARAAALGRARRRRAR